MYAKLGLLESKLKTANLTAEQVEFIEKRIINFSDSEIELYLRYVLDNQVPTLDEQFDKIIKRDNT